MIAWANLWKWTVFRPETRRPRVLLTFWEALLGFIVWAAGHWLPWWGIFVGCGGAFFMHELFFQMWAERIARVPEMPASHAAGYVATLERWTGPVA